MAKQFCKLSGQNGEFSGYYCKFVSVIDSRLLCVPSQSQYVEEVSTITDVPDCLRDSAEYSSAVPQEPLNYQQWLMVWMPENQAYKIINRASGMLLCVQSGTDKENQRIITSHDQSLNSQLWKLRVVRPECFKVINYNTKSSKVLTTRGGSVIQQTSNNYSEIQLWHIIPLDNSGYIGEYHIRNVHSSKLLSIKGQSLADNARAIIYAEIELSEKEKVSNYQVWRLFVCGWDKGGFVIQNTHSGKILCISGRATISGAKAVQYKDQELPYQKWGFELARYNHLKIVNKVSGLYLGVQDHKTTNESFIVQLRDQNQCWEFVKLSGDLEMDLDKLIKFYYNTSQEFSGRQVSDSIMNPDVRKWYENLIQTFIMEVLVLIGVFPSPTQEDLITINRLVLASSLVVTKLQVLLEATVSIESFILIVELFWKHDLWCPILKYLLRQVWSLPTLVKAMTTIRSWISGAGTVQTIYLLHKSVVVLGLIRDMKPKRGKP